MSDDEEIRHDEEFETVSIPVSELLIEDEFWQGEHKDYRVTGPTKTWASTVRVQVEYADGGRGEREWLGNPTITVRRPK